MMQLIVTAILSALVLAAATDINYYSETKGMQSLM